MNNITLSALNSWLQPKKQPVLLFDSITAACEIAFMLNGQWDECNGVMIPKCDEVAVNTAAAIMQAEWCYQGAEKSVLNRLTHDELLRRYAIGERHFLNANLRCAQLSFLSLCDINLSWAKLNLANLSGSNLSKAFFIDADICEANLTDINLSQSQLVRANLTKASLLKADLKKANLSHACLVNANLSQADLRGANLFQADLSGANLTEAIFDN